MKILGGLFALTAMAAVAQHDQLRPVTYPKLSRFVRQPTGFVPPGWKLIAVKMGDLNRDGRSDVAVLMRMTDPANVKPVDTKVFPYKEDDTNPYLLAIGFAEADGGYMLAASNHDLFPREVAPMHEDDPPSVDTFTVSHRVLSLTFGHLRGFDSYRFRWNGKAFALVGFDCGGAVGGSFVGLSANYLTRTARIERGEIGSDKTNVRTVRIRPGKRPTLDQSDWDYGWMGQDIHGHDLSC